MTFSNRCDHSGISQKDRIAPSGPLQEPQTTRIKTYRVSVLLVWFHPGVCTTQRCLSLSHMLRVSSKWVKFCLSATIVSESVFLYHTSYAVFFCFVLLQFGSFSVKALNRASIKSQKNQKKQLHQFLLPPQQCFFSSFLIWVFVGKLDLNACYVQHENILINARTNRKGMYVVGLPHTSLFLPAFPLSHISI